MERLEVSTDVYVPPERVYEFLVDFPGYARYSEYLRSVERQGDGTAGTVYEITAAWWRLSHTVRSEVTDIDPPTRIDWRLLGPIQASGAWVIDPRSPAQASPSDAGPGDPDGASTVSLVIRYDPGSITAGRIDLPSFLSFEALADRLAPRLEREATRTVERIVADLEGEPRPIELRVDTDPGDEPTATNGIADDGEGGDEAAGGDTAASGDETAGSDDVDGDAIE